MQTGNNQTTHRRKSIREKMDNVVVLSCCSLSSLLLVGHAIRQRSKWIRAFHLPASVVGGIVGWIFFAIVDIFDVGSSIADDWFSVGWNVLPSICTDVVFSCLFLGSRVPRPSEVLSSPRREHLMYGLVVVFGQYFVSCIVTIVSRWADPTLAAPFATVMPYGFAGGPVVAEAMKPLYAVDSFNYPDGYALALLAATIGMFAGVICGTVLVNMAPLQNSLHVQTDPDTAASRSCIRRFKASMIELKSTAGPSDMIPPRRRVDFPVTEQTVSVDSIDSLALHLCMIGMVMFGASLLRIPFVLIEEAFPTGSFLERSNILSVLPLFLFCLIAGIIIQYFIDRWYTDSATGKSFIDRPTIVRISNTAQDILVVAAISRLGRNGLPPGVYGLGPFFHIILTRGIPFALVCAAGVAWGVFAFWFLGPRLLPDYWVERALVEFGVSIGATSTGLLLLRMADPEGRSPVLSDFTYKQILHVLFTGGGFFDVLIPIPLCSATNSAWPLLVVVSVIIGGLIFFHPMVRRRRQRGGGTPIRSTRTVEIVPSNATGVVDMGDATIHLNEDEGSKGL